MEESMGTQLVTHQPGQHEVGDEEDRADHTAADEDEELGLEVARKHGCSSGRQNR